MRDQYAGDVSDYLKFAFLRSVVPADARLGVAWYYLPGHDGRADGRHDEYLTDPAWTALDPDLFERLGRRSRRSVDELEALQVLPASTAFHREPVPVRRDRSGWRITMLSRLESCDVVFADPDNGVSRPDVVIRKSATVDEIKALGLAGRLTILIRFPHRQASHDAQLADYHATFAEFRPVTLRTCVRVPNSNGSTSPRIRWFTVMNPKPDTRARMFGFQKRLETIPGATARLEVG
jgi:hypothetical protein